MPKTILTIGLAVSLVGTFGCTKDLELDQNFFACQTDADCVDSVCDPQAKVCRSPGQDVSSLYLDPPDADANIGAEASDDLGVDIAPDIDPGEPVECQEYCEAVLAACGENTSNPVTGQYLNLSSCLSICETSMYNGSDIDLRGGKDLPQGNTLSCRLAQAEKATASYEAAVEFCDSAGFSGGNICGSWCDMYCHLDVAHCGQFASEGECQTACANFDTGGSANALDGDSVQCRIYHSMAAGLDKPATAETHCPHAKVVSGDDMCGAPIEPPDCETYCTNITANCVGDLARYPDHATCVSTCSTLAKFDVGTPTDKNGNTIGCRLFHAKAAQFEPAFHCRAAGPGGNDICGSWCDNHCDLEAKNCLEDADIFATEEECHAACALYPDDGAPGDAIGDSVQCRSYHITVAGFDQDQARIHCPHGNVLSDDTHCQGDPPTPTCDEMCNLATANCAAGTANEVFASNEACLNYCYQLASLESGTFLDATGNTIGCRINAAKNASVDPATWCPPVSEYGGGVCGSTCQIYCDLSLAICPSTNNGQDGRFPNADACQIACSGMSDDGQPGDVTGNTLQCRIYHLLDAAADPDGQSDVVHCPHTLPGDTTEQCQGPPP